MKYLEDNCNTINRASADVVKIRVTRAALTAMINASATSTCCFSVYERVS